MPFEQRTMTQPIDTSDVTRVQAHHLAAREWLTAHYARMGVDAAALRHLGVDGAAEATLELIRGEIRDDPLVRRAQPEINAGAWYTNTGWRAIAEQRLSAAGLMLAYRRRDSSAGESVVGVLETCYPNDATDAGAPVSVLGGVIDMMRARTYLWPAASMELALAAPLPEPFDIELPLLDYDMQFWTWERPWTWGVYADTGQRLSNNWIMLRQEDEHLVILFDLSASDPALIPGPVPFLIGGMSIPQHATWPTFFDAEAEAVMEAQGLSGEARDHGAGMLHAVMGRILRLIAFMGSDYTTETAERLDRPTRRAMARAGAAGSDDLLVHTIRYHRPRVDDRTTHDTGDGAGRRQYSHQWWVRGHIRRQWYASLGQHRLKWIPAHLRGPSDKPIKASAPTVRKVG